MKNIEKINNAKLMPINAILNKYGISDDYIINYGKYIAKIDIDNLKKEVKELGLQEVITFDDAEYKIVGWGDLETRFNDDRYLQNRELNERGER